MREAARPIRWLAAYERIGRMEDEEAETGEARVYVPPLEALLPASVAATITVELAEAIAEGQALAKDLKRVGGL